MQLKFSKQYTARQTIAKRITKLLLVLASISFAIFLLEKVKFPSPEKEIKKDITNEIIILK